MSPTVHKESLFHLSLVEQSYSDIPHVPELSSLRLSVSNAVWGIGSNSENESEVQSDICRLLPQCLCHRRTCISNQPDTIVRQRFCSKVSVYGFFPPIGNMQNFQGATRCLFRQGIPAWLSPISECIFHSWSIPCLNASSLG